VMALALFADEDYEEVAARLTETLREWGCWDDAWEVPTSGGITQARQRLGAEPLRELFAQVAVPVAEEETLGAFLGAWRLMAIETFIRDTFDLAEFGSGRESLGAAVFCAVPAAVDDGEVRWVAWTFGSAGCALRRSAQDPRFGLLAVLKLLVVPLLKSGEDRSIRYILFPRERGIGQGNVTLAMTAIGRLLRQMRDDDAADAGLDADLRFLDESGELIGTATVLECISATLKQGDAEFIAYDGDFYAVNHSFVSRIDAELSKIPVSGLRYPPYGGETEPDYNNAAARSYPDKLSYPDKFVLLDRALIELPDEHRIEAADLVCSSGALIHVKRKGKSSVLSHLFLQVANNCELLRRSTLAWQKHSLLIRERAASDPIIASIDAAHASARKRESELEVAFAFLGDWSGKPSRACRCSPGSAW
jgi:Insertion element 4 transposase N-terminal/Family of unknown function (DUF6119)